MCVILVGEIDVFATRIETNLFFRQAGQEISELNICQNVDTSLQYNAAFQEA